MASLASGVPVFSGRLAPEALLDGDGRPAEALDFLRGRRVVAVSGIARPEAFAAMLEGLGAEIAEHHAYPDHAAYLPLDGARLEESLRRMGADLLLTTEKDAVKLAPLLAGKPLRALRVGLEVGEGASLARMALQAAGRLSS